MAGQVKPIPEGYHTITPTLVVSGGGRAIDFYKRAFGAVEKFRMSTPDGKVGHAELRIGDSPIMLSDASAYPGSKSPESLGGTPVSLYVYVEDVDKLFNQAVAAGGKADMPVADMFWGDRCGMLTDPFGHRWAIATHKADLTPEQIEKGEREFRAKMSQRAQA